MAATRYQVGDRVGRWTIKAKLKPVNHARRWLVECECGFTAPRYAVNLTSGRSRSCGTCGQGQRRDDEKKGRET